MPIFATKSCAALQVGKAPYITCPLGFKKNTLGIINFEPSSHSFKRIEMFFFNPHEKIGTCRPVFRSKRDTQSRRQASQTKDDRLTPWCGFFFNFKCFLLLFLFAYYHLHIMVRTKKKRGSISIHKFHPRTKKKKSDTITVTQRCFPKFYILLSNVIECSCWRILLILLIRSNIKRSIYITFALVSNDPNPQKVPPPVAVPPMRSYLVSDSTYYHNHYNHRQIIVFGMGNYLHNAHAGANVYEKIRENAGLHAGETVLRVGMTLVGKHLVLDIFQ